MSNNLYDVLKWIAQIALPALATLYFALAEIWGFPYAAEVVGTARDTIRRAELNRRHGKRQHGDKKHKNNLHFNVVKSSIAHSRKLDNA